MTGTHQPEERRVEPPGNRVHTLKGFADLHNHQFAYLGFGGVAFHGRAFGDPAEALHWCDYEPGIPGLRQPIHGPGGLGDVIGNVLRHTYGGPPGIGHRVGGYPQFDGWPRWDSVTHQTMYADWLRRAVDGGLRLMVMLAVNNEFLCRVVNKKLSCNDMEAADRQLAAAKLMEAYIDAQSGGRGKGWYRIVYTPAQARKVIEAGKLAVVLGIEVDYLFNCRQPGDLTEAELKRALGRYFALGVRHLFPIHLCDNGFGGTAFQNATERGLDAEHPEAEWNFVKVSPLNPLATLGAYVVHTEEARAQGYGYRTGRRNIHGLTSLGKTLMREMMRRGMLCDVDHMSARSKADVFELCEAEDYPVVSGHTGFIELSVGEKRHEGQLLPAEVERIRKLGGMVAFILRQGDLKEVKAWQGPGQPHIPHTCGNTSNTAVQAYLYTAAKMQGGPVAIGTDFNGFAGLPGPRFGAEAAPGGGMPGPGAPLGYPFVAATTGSTMERSVVGQKTFDINVDGVAHVGMLPDLIADFQAQGLSLADLDPLLHSAEGYVRMWQKAWDHRPGARLFTRLAGALRGLRR